MKNWVCFKSFETRVAPVEGYCLLKPMIQGSQTLIGQLLSPLIFVSATSEWNLVSQGQLSGASLLSLEHTEGRLGQHHELSRNTTPYRSSLQHLILIGSAGLLGLDWKWQSADKQIQTVCQIQFLMVLPNSRQARDVWEKHCWNRDSTWMSRILYSWCNSFKAWMALESIYVTAARKNIL